MKYVKIKPEQTTFFSQLDPFGYLDHMTLPGYFAIGLTENDEEIENRICGLMICYCTSDALVIEWLCIDPDFESDARGEGLLLKAFEIAEALGKPRLCALMSSDADSGKVCSSARSYFTERLFEKEEELPGEWNAMLGPIARSSWLDSAGKLPVTSALGEAAPDALRSFLDHIPEEGNACRSPLMEEANLKTFDRSISRVITDGGDVCGLLLVQNTQDGLWPLFLYAESENEAKALIKDACKEAGTRFAPDTDVWVRIRTEAAEKLLETIAPKKIRDRYLLSAEVSEYRKNR